jgi:Holliday junction resolvase-like predicted endonuclease
VYDALTNKEKGKIGEQIAKRFLVSRGYRIIDCNWRNKYGEIDIIAIERDAYAAGLAKRTTASKVRNAGERGSTTKVRNMRNMRNTHEANPTTKSHTATKAHNMHKSRTASKPGAPSPVSRRNKCVVVFEVKTRTTISAGYPEESVDYRKMKKLRNLAVLWGEQNDTFVLRIDVLSVSLDSPGIAKVRHLKNVGW